MASEPRRGLVVIGVLKLLKALGLVVIGASILSLLHHDTRQTVQHWLGFLGVDIHAHLVERLLAKLAGVNARSLRHVGVGTLLYATVFGTEGVGLILGMAWAEYMTTAVTVSFLPLEGYELARHLSLVRLAVIVINVAVVIYLLLEIRRRRQHASASPPASSG